MSVGVSTEANSILDTYLAYALLEEEQNLLLLLAHLKKTLTLSSDVANNLSIILADPPDLGKRAYSILHIWSYSKNSELYRVIDHLKKSDEELNNLKKNNKTLSEHIDAQRVLFLKKEKLHKAFKNLVSSKVGVAVGLADPSYILYASPDGSSSNSASASGAGLDAYPIVERLKSAAQALSSAHILVAAQAIFGAIGIINFFISELYSANKLQKRLNELNLQKIGTGMRFKKNILLGSLFSLRAVILGISIGLTAVALTTPVGAATLLMVALLSYSIEEFGHLNIEIANLKKLIGNKEKLESEIETLIDKNSKTEISVMERLKIIGDLKESRKKSGEIEVAVLILEEKVSLSVGRRNKTLYNTIGASLIIISPLFPPLFLVGVSMLAIPLVVGAARYVDEKWNKGKISKAIINSAVGQLIMDSTLYKKMFGDRFSRQQDIGNASDLIKDVSIPKPAPKEVAKGLEIAEEPNHTIVHGLNNATKGDSLKNSLKKESLDKDENKGKTITEHPQDIHKI